MIERVSELNIGEGWETFSGFLFHYQKLESIIDKKYKGVEKRIK